MLKEMTSLKKFTMIVGAALVAVVALSGCGGGGGGSSSGKVTDLGTVNLSDDMKFTPNTFTGAPGEFKVTLVNKGTQLHDFTIKGTNVKIDVPAGQTVTKTFKIEKAGKYDLECTQPGHKDGGMKGTVEVKG